MSNSQWVIFLLSLQPKDSFYFLKYTKVYSSRIYNLKIKEILIDEKYKISEKSRSLIIINLFKISRTLRVALKLNIFFKTCPDSSFNNRDN